MFRAPQGNPFKRMTAYLITSCCKICCAYSTVTTPLKNGALYQAKLGCIKGGLEEDSALRCLSQAVGRYGAAKMVCQMHYESLADGSLLDDEDTLAEYFGTNLPIETVKGLLRQEFKEEFEEELDP